MSTFQFEREEFPTHIDFKISENEMLGKQAEACFEYYLVNSERYNLLAHNIQIHGANETIGEIDYLVYDSGTKTDLHIELACKFYLYDETIEGSFESKWIGPNRKDTLKDKLEKLRSKQFPLLQKQETIDLLNERNLYTSSIKQQLCLKAFLFVPKMCETTSLAVSYQNCIVGCWIRFSEFSSEDITALYLIPPKTQWLHSPEELKGWKSHSEATQILQNSIAEKRSALIYKKSESKIERLFVIWW